MPCAALEYFVATSLLFQKSLEADEAAVWDIVRKLRAKRARRSRVGEDAI